MGVLSKHQETTNIFDITFNIMYFINNSILSLFLKGNKGIFTKWQ